jgi:hypothetical protein
MTPKIVPQAFPEPEWSAITRVWQAHNVLVHHIDSFASALKLFDVCAAHVEMGKQRNEDVTDYRSWKKISARDGAMQIFHVWHCLKAVSQALPGCPTLRSHVDLKALRAAMGIFRGQFPNFEAVRYIVAHGAEAAARANEHEAKGDLPGIKTGDSAVMITDMIDGRIYRATYQGKHVSYEISTDTLNQLARIAQHSFSAFKQAEEATMQSLIEKQEQRHRERAAQPPKD